MNVIENYYDIAILPSPEVRKYCIQLSREINKRFGSETVLSQAQNLPHISLLHTAFSQHHLPLVRRQLADLARETEPFQVRLHGFLNYPQFGSVTVEVKPKLPFVKLHEQVIARTRDYIDRDFNYRAQWHYETAYETEKAYIDEFTTPLVKEYFHPHITLNNGVGREAIDRVEEMKIRRT